MSKLSDSVAQQIMGEIGDLVGRIECVAEKVPRTESLRVAVDDVLDEFKKTASITAVGETARMKAELAQAAAEIAGKVSKDVAGREKARWIAGCAVAACVSFSAFGWMMHNTGYSAGLTKGHEQGYTEAKNEAAAASWANTQEGRLAQRLAENGSIQMLANCTGKGWKVRDNTCLPFPVNENNQEVSYGWKVDGSITGNQPGKQGWFN